MRRCCVCSGAAACRHRRNALPSQIAKEGSTGTVSGSTSDIEWVGWQNYHDITTIYPPFWPAVRHNLIWLLFLAVFPTLLGVLLAFNAVAILIRQKFQKPLQ